MPATSAICKALGVVLPQQPEVIAGRRKEAVVEALPAWIFVIIAGFSCARHSLLWHARVSYSNITLKLQIPVVRGRTFNYRVVFEYASKLYPGKGPKKYRTDG